MPILNKTRIDDCKEEIIFSYDKDKVNKVIDEIALEIGKHSKIPGNRPGKASIDAVRIYARKLVLDNSANKLLNDGFQDILYETKWKPFSQPEVKDVKITFDSFSAKYVVGYMPEVTLSKYKEIELEEPTNLPSNEVLFDKFVENVCNQFSNQKPFSEDDFILIGDNAIINFEGTIDGKPFNKNKGEGALIEVGKGNTVDGFDDNLIGMKVGEKREFELSFGKNAPNKELIDKTVKFVVELIAAARKEPASFDDELAKKVKFETLDQLKEDINKKVEEYKKELTFNLLKSSAVNKLLELNEVNIPEWMVLSTAENAAKIQSEDFHKLSNEEKEELLSETSKNIKLAFILEKIKDSEIETVLSESELMKILDNNISRMPENIKHELIEGKNMALYSKLLNDIQTEYVIKWVTNNAKIVKKIELTEAKKEGE